MLRVTRAVVTVLLCAAMLAVPASAWAKWTELSSPHFVFVGDAPERAIRNVAQRLEQFRKVAGRVLSDGIVSSPVPTVVVVFENDKSFTPFKPVYQGKPIAVAGYFVGMEDANYIAVNAEQDSTAYGVIFHEYAHFLVANAYGETPVWVNEGLAGFYQTFDVNGAKSAVIGGPSDHHLQLLRSVPLMPVSELAAVERNSPLYNESERRGLFYAESWALVHYLSLGSPARQGQLRTYLGALRQGTPWTEAFAAAFGADTTALDRELQQYVRAFSFNTLRFDFDDKLATVPLAPGKTLSDSDASGYLGDLLARQNRVDDARAFLKAIINSHADAARATASLGMLELRTANNAVAVSLLERAAALAPGDPTILSAYGRVLARLADRALDDSDALYEKARVVLGKALDLQPDSAPAMVSLAEVEMGSGIDTARAVTLMRAATKAAPGREEYRLMLAQALAVNRDYAGASAMLGVLVARSARPEIRDAASEALGRVATARLAAERVSAASRANGIRSDDTATAPPSSNAAASPSSTDAPRPTMPQGAYSILLRPVGAGETRVQGTFASVECRQGAIVLQIDTAGGPVRMAAARFGDIELVTFRDNAPIRVTCGPQQPGLPVLATFRRDDALAGSAGTPNRAVAIEVVPDGYVPR